VSDPGITEGIGVRNATSRTLRFAVETGDGRIELPAVAQPGDSTLLVSGSAIGEHSRVVANGCIVGPVVAMDASGREVARNDDQLCVGEGWTVTEP
jgi:hypothetical protein